MSNQTGLDLNIEMMLNDNQYGEPRPGQWAIGNGPLLSREHALYEVAEAYRDKLSTALRANVVASNALQNLKRELAVICLSLLMAVALVTTVKVCTTFLN